MVYFMYLHSKPFKNPTPTFSIRVIIGNVHCE